MSLLVMRTEVAATHFVWEHPVLLLAPLHSVRIVYAVTVPHPSRILWHRASPDEV